MSKTADEIIAELAKNKKFQAEKRAREEKFRALEKKLDADERPIIQELAKVGINVRSVWDLVNTSDSYYEAIPILISHLQKSYHPKTLAGLARALAVSDTNKFEEAWGGLLSLYKNTASDEAISEPEFRGAKEGLAVALSFLCNSDRLEDLLGLIRNAEHGESRALLLDCLSKFKG